VSWFFGGKTVADYLNEVPGSIGGWGLLERYPTKMYSSGEQHEAWIFSRGGAERADAALVSGFGAGN
jgi:hypothetical protein